MNEELKFPVYAIFIGANLGLASLSFIKVVLKYISIRWTITIMYILLISALVCIFSSNIFGKGSITFKYFAVILLILGYFLLLILPFYVPKREREVKETKEILSSIEENLGELFEKFQKNSEI